MSQRTRMRLSPFWWSSAFRPQRRGERCRGRRDACVDEIPQVLGYTRIAATPVVTGLYAMLLPLVAFSVSGPGRLKPIDG